MRLLRFVNQDLSLKDVTLISLAAVNLTKVVTAIEKSQKRIVFFDAKIISPDKPPNLSDRIKWEKSPPLRLRASGIDDYSHYMIYNIWQHVQSEFCLVVQADGYVLNPECWNEDFLSYDYIGAPWPVKSDSYIDPFGKNQRVGNGGFSLRSKKLLQVPREAKVKWDVNRGKFYKHFGAQSLAEDGNICVHNRHVYESRGCNFAPLEVAIDFSRELPIPEFDGRKTFGFHRYKP